MYNVSRVESRDHAVSIEKIRLHSLHDAVYRIQDSVEATFCLRCFAAVGADRSDAITEVHCGWCLAQHVRIRLHGSSSCEPGDVMWKEVGPCEREKNLRFIGEEND